MRSILLPRSLDPEQEILSKFSDIGFTKSKKRVVKCSKWSVKLTCLNYILGDISSGSKLMNFNPRYLLLSIRLTNKMVDLKFILCQWDFYGMKYNLEL